MPPKPTENQTTVWDALDAASRAIVASNVMGSPQQASAAIAAFLRALPEWQAHEGMPSQEALARLAREVERLSK